MPIIDRREPMGIEKNLDRLQSQWLGEEQTKELGKVNEMWGSGDFWEQ